MTDKMTINDAKSMWSFHLDKKCICEPHNPSTYCYKSCGFIEAWESRDAEVEELKKIIKDLGSEDVLKEKME